MSPLKHVHFLTQTALIFQVFQINLCIHNLLEAFCFVFCICRPGILNLLQAV